MDDVKNAIINEIMDALEHTDRLDLLIMVKEFTDGVIQSDQSL